MQSHKSYTFSKILTSEDEKPCLECAHNHTFEADLHDMSHKHVLVFQLEPSSLVRNGNFFSINDAGERDVWHVHLCGIELSCYVNVLTLFSRKIYEMPKSVMTLTQWKVYLQCIGKNQTPNHWNYKKQKFLLRLVHSQVMVLGLFFSFFKPLGVFLFLFLIILWFYYILPTGKYTLLCGVMLYISLLFFQLQHMQGASGLCWHASRLHE